MNKILFAFTILMLPLSFAAAEGDTLGGDDLALARWGQRSILDSLPEFEAISVTAIKQHNSLQREPLSALVMGQQAIERERVEAIKDLSAIAPNLYIPDYGSRITSSIYVRGLGARIDQPVMGLTIDNVPFINKNAFDLSLVDLERVEVLRGPQSTLYGRNTMCGQMNIYTLSPMNYQGVRVGAEYSTGNTYMVRAALYHKFSEQFAASLALFRSASDGYHTNLYTDEKCESESSWGVRSKQIYRASSRTTIENTLSASTLEQGGYAYKNLATNEINYNDPSNYERITFNDGLTIQHRGDGWTLSSITGYQYLDDCMTLDQDFTTESMFTLQQAIQNHSLTEDVIFKSDRRDRKYNYLFGVFGFYDHKNMQAPVRFKEDGVDYLIFDNVNGTKSYYDRWDDNGFDLNSEFLNQTYGAALYHESRYRSGRFEASIGLRLDYERTVLDYRSYTSTGCYGNITQSDGSIKEFYKPIEIDLQDKISQSQFELLPKATLLYRLGVYQQSMLYGSVSKGYKAGGYNSQMFSDILQQRVMQIFGLSMAYSAEDIISYKPEYSWNYEIGAHLTTPNRKFAADLTLFYIDCRDQQLTIFPDDMVTGRLMTNAGHSRSYGTEFTSRIELGRLLLNGSYGYTNARFVTYDDNTADYSGNFIPYAPRQTIYGSAEYRVALSHKFFEAVTFNVNARGVGEIYWNEANTLSQPLYAQLGGEVRFSGDGYTLSLWGRNLGDKSYNTFYFMSMGNEFVQEGRPRTVGVSLNLDIN